MLGGFIVQILLALPALAWLKQMGGSYKVTCSIKKLITSLEFLL